MSSVDLLTSVYGTGAGCSGLDGKDLRFGGVIHDELWERWWDHPGAAVPPRASAHRKGSASEAALTAAMAARERALRVLAIQESVTASKEPDPTIEISFNVRERYGSKLVMYGSSQTHSLGAKVSHDDGVSFRYSQPGGDSPRPPMAGDSRVH